MYPRILALGLAVLLMSARAADLIPIEDFARTEAYLKLEISPDGEYVGVIREYEGVRRLCLVDLATMKMVALNLPESGLSPAFARDVHDFEWLGAKRVLLDTSLGWAATDRDRKRFKDFGWQSSEKGVHLGIPDVGYGRVVWAFADDRNVIMTNHRMDLGREEMKFPEVSKLDTVTGLGTAIVKNPGTVVRWVADLDGQVRAGVSISDAGESLLWRPSEKDDWRTVASAKTKLEFEIKGFSEDGASLYVFARSETGAGGVYRFDPVKQQLGELLWSNPVYEPDALVRDPNSKKLVGVRYVAEYPRTQWFDARYVAFQAAVDKALVGRVNRLGGFSTDLSRILVRSFSDREPESAYIFNTKSGEIREIGKTRGWLKSGQMASMQPISYVSRDGIRIFGYLTIPIGVNPEKLPLVVLPHASLHQRDILGFDPFVQFLANRGYAVLQVNQRGSSGYGWAFREKSTGETGGKVQADIEDATRWVIARKIADPKRIAVVGVWYGGYSVLHALAKNPELYCCGAAIAPISDWREYLAELNPNTGIVIRVAQSESPVDAKVDGKRFMEISPINYAAEIRAPLLIIKRDSIDPLVPRQAQAIIDALGKAGHAPELLAIPYKMEQEKARLAEFKAIEAFLAKHLGAGATKDTAPAVLSSSFNKDDLIAANEASGVLNSRRASLPGGKVQ